MIRRWYKVFSTHFLKCFGSGVTVRKCLCLLFICCTVPNVYETVFIRLVSVPYLYTNLTPLE